MRGADGADECYSNIIRYNTIYNQSVTVWAGCIQFYTGTTADHKSHDNEAYYNLIYDSPSAFFIQGDADNNKIYNNVVYNCTRGISIIDDGTHDPQGNIVKNNIFHSCGTSLVNVSAGYFPSNTFDNNCYYDASGYTNKYIYGATQDDSLAAWQSTTSQDANSQESDPLMTDPANDDFTLQNTSPCIGKGINVNLVRDYAGTQAPSGHVDIGAYENKAKQGWHMDDGF